jgi:hypothetical protein
MAVFPAKENFQLKNPKRTYQVGNFESKFKPEMVKPQQQILANIDSKQF